MHNVCNKASSNSDAPKKIYSSVKKAPGYDNRFTKVVNGTKRINIKNKPLLEQLNKVGKGWKKVYSNGYVNNKKASLHYFQDRIGQVFDVKMKYGGWS